MNGLTTQSPRGGGFTWKTIFYLCFRVYVALDEEYISPNEFKDVYEQARRTRAAVRGFINYLKKYEKRNATNPEP